MENINKATKANYNLSFFLFLVGMIASQCGKPGYLVLIKSDWKNSSAHHNSTNATYLSSGKCKFKPQRDITSHLSRWLLAKKQKTTSVNEAVLVGMQNGAATVQMSMEFPKKNKNRTTM